MTVVVKHSLRGKHKFGQFPEDMLIAVEESSRLVLASAEMLLHVDVEMLHHLGSHLVHPLVYLLLHVGLKTLEGRVYLFLTAALLIYLPDAVFDVDIVGLAKHLVTGSKHVVEEFELVAQQFKYSYIGIVSCIDEVYYHHVKLLSITMAAAYTLFYTLRVPRQVEIN